MILCSRRSLAPEREVSFNPWALASAETRGQEEDGVATRKLEKELFPIPFPFPSRNKQEEHDRKAGSAERDAVFHILGLGLGFKIQGLEVYIDSFRYT